MQPTCWDCGNNLTLWISSNLYYFACRLTGGFVEASVLLCKRQQVDFTFLPQQGVVQPSRKLSQPAFLIWRWKTSHLSAKYSCSQRVCMFIFLQGLSVQTALCMLQHMFMYVFCLSFIFLLSEKYKRRKNSFVPESSAQSQMLKMERGQRVRENKVNIAGLVNFGSVIKLPRQQGKPH